MPSVAQKRQSTIDEIVEETKQDLQEWKRLEELWGECLQKTADSKEFLMKFISDKANGGIHQHIDNCLHEP